MISKIYVQSHVHCSTIHTGQDMETITAESINKMWYIQWKIIQPEKRRIYCHIQQRGQKSTALC